MNTLQENREDHLTEELIRLSSHVDNVKSNLDLVWKVIFGVCGSIVATMVGLVVWVSSETGDIGNKLDNTIDRVLDRSIADKREINERLDSIKPKVDGLWAIIVELKKKEDAK